MKSYEAHTIFFLNVVLQICLYIKNPGFKLVKVLCEGGYFTEADFSIVVFVHQVESKSIKSMLSFTEFNEEPMVLKVKRVWNDLVVGSQLLGARITCD